MFNRKLAALPLGIAALAVGGASAFATTVGSPSTTNTQYVGDSQGANQSMGGGIVVGGVTQQGSINGATTYTNTQTVGSAGSTTVGNAVAGNTQGGQAIQSVTQTAGAGGTTVGTVTQSMTDNNSTLGGNTQSVNASPGGGVVVGNPGAFNNQSATTSQVSNQSEGGGVIVGAVTQGGLQENANRLSNSETVGTSGSVIVGNPQASSSQLANTPQWIGQTTAGGTLVSTNGPLSQTQDNENTNTAVNTVVII